MFIDSGAFPWVAELERGADAIRRECMALQPDSFDPWVQREMYDEGWSVYGLVAFGERIEASLAQCPSTAELLDKVPGLTTAGFSRLAAGARIRPHVGWVTQVYRGHLGLAVPDRCAIRVGADTRAWAEGRCLIFDDTAEHEAWNDSARDRFVLLFDFLRPGMPADRQDVPPEAVQAFVRKRLDR